MVTHVQSGCVDMKKVQVTVLFFLDTDLRLRDQVIELTVGEGGRAIIPADFKRGKQIIGVLQGECRLLNRIGDRIMPLSSVKVSEHVE